MALSAKLFLGNNQMGTYSHTYDVVECTYHFYRHHNRRFPDTKAKLDRAEITVIAPGKEDTNLYEWYIEQIVNSGKIVFDLTAISEHTPQPTKVLTFENATCFSIAEHYDIGKQRRRQLRLEIMAEEIVVENVTFKQYIGSL